MCAFTTIDFLRLPYHMKVPGAQLGIFEGTGEINERAYQSLLKADVGGLLISLP